jgi:heme/copper-type cytochrome/quinol oxidase subunit 2
VARAVTAAAAVATAGVGTVARTSLKRHRLARIGLGFGAAVLAGAFGPSSIARDGGSSATAVTASSSGFQPARLEFRRDEAVQLKLTTRDVEHCFSLDAFRVEKRLLPGREVSVRFLADAAGRFPYRCCLGGDHDEEAGELVVHE